MENIFVEFLPPWIETGLQPAFYDKESGTVLQQTARMYARVNMLIRMFNKLSKNTKEEVERFEKSVNETVEDYINQFNELHDYVHDYFDNLDVQEEINNKLDAMTEAGTLQEIITSYIQANVAWTFDSVADMKLATNLVAGSYAQTLGFHSLNDGGGATYYITDSGTANEMDVIAVDSLYANLVLPDVITPEMVGAYGNGSNNDTTYLQRAIDLGYSIKLSNSYLVNGLSLKSGIHLYGVDSATIISNANHWCLYNTNSDEIENVTIENIKFIGHGNYSNSDIDEDINRDCGIYIKNSKNVNINKCDLSDFGACSIGVFGKNIYITDNVLSSDIDYSSGGALPNYSFGIQVDGDNIHVENNNISGYIHGVINGANTINLFIESNMIAQRHQHGIYLASGSNININGNNIMANANAIAGIKLQANTSEHHINKAIITNNIIQSGNTEGAQGILVTAYDYSAQSPIDDIIDEVIISGNKILANRGVEANNIKKALIENNLIETRNATATYGIRMTTQSITNLPSKCKFYVYNNTITSLMPINTGFPASVNISVDVDIAGNNLYTPLSSTVKNRTSVSFTDSKANYVNIRNNYIECEPTDDQATYGFTDGIVFNVTNLAGVVLMGNCTKENRWGCRNLVAYDASKIVNVGNAFNTQLNITA